MIIKAKFIGKSSLGFVYGKMYNLDCKFRWKLGSNPCEAGVNIQTNSGSFPNYERLRCEYNTVDIFLSLWKVSSIHLYDVVSPQLQQCYDEISRKFHKNMRDNKIEMILSLV